MMEQGVAVSPYLPPPEHSPRGVYHEMLLRLAYDFWRREIRRLVSGTMDEHRRILECGCGPGFLLKFMERWFPSAQIIGLDLDISLLVSACTRVFMSRLIQASAVELPISSNSIDLLIALHMIEHLANPERFMSEARRVLRSGGHLVVATPNPASIGAKVMGRRWAGWRDDHLSLHPPGWWRALFQKSDFRIIKEGTTGLSGIPLFRTLPFALVNWGPLFLFGMFPWILGESYICIASSSDRSNSSGSIGVSDEHDP